MMNKPLLVLVLIFASFVSFGQLRDIRYDVSSITSLSTGDDIPFWMQSNKHGIIQNSNSSLLKLDIQKQFNNKSLIDYSFGLDCIGSIGDSNDFYLNQYFAKIKLLKMQLSIGAENPIERFGGLSATNGSIIFSGNARPIPMFSAKLIDFVDIPFTRGYLSFKGSLSHGWMPNERYVKDVYLHHKNLYIRLGKDEGLSVTGGIEHYVFWDGVSPRWGALEGGFKNYSKIFFVESGDPIVADDGTVSENESIWKLGDHRGQNSIEICYNNDHFSTSVYLKSIYEDSSNMNIFTNKDRNIGFYINLKKGKIINAFMYEHFSTVDQSGIRPQPHKELVEKYPYLGPDGNFNHSIYASGWTNHGRVIGMPLMLARNQRGVMNSAIKAHHIGVKGEIMKFKYKFLYTYSENYGNTSLGESTDGYYQSYTYESPLKQQSLCLEILMPNFDIPFDISSTLAYDFGDLLSDNNFGFQIKISKSGFFGK